MFTNVRYILLTALRDWLFATLMIGIITCAMIAHMLGGTALIETQEINLSYISASARIILMTGIILFTCFHVRNAFDTKEIDVFLSRPITRSNLVFSYWLGFVAVSVLLLLPILALVFLQGILNMKGFFLWSGSLLIECLLVVAIALFCAFTSKSAIASTLASMGIYALARMMGFFVVTVQSSSASGDPWLNGIPAQALKLLSGIMPRLDFFAKSDWLIYGTGNVHDLKIFTAQAMIFIPFLILATIADFRRKQF